MGSQDNHPTRQGLGDNRIVLAAQCPRFTAYCSPEANGDVYVDDTEVSRSVLGQSGAPFPFDIVFHDVYPAKGEVEPLAEYLGGAFANEFGRRVDEVYKLVADGDDPLDALMDMDPSEVSDRVSSERV